MFDTVVYEAENKSVAFSFIFSKYEKDKEIL